MINDIDGEYYPNKDLRIKAEDKYKHALRTTTLETIDSVTEQLYITCKYPSQKNSLINMYINYKERMLNIKTEYKHLTYKQMEEREDGLKREEKVAKNSNNTNKNNKKR